MLIDLHTHTIYSDGLLSVEELVKKAASKSVRVLALTDHDTVAGLPSFLKICPRHKIKAVPGIELSTESEEVELHLVGYLKNFSHPELLKHLKTQQQKRLERAKKMIEKFRALRFVITLETAKRLLAQNNVGKPQIGRAILKEKANRALLRGAYHFKGGLSEFIGYFLDKPEQIGYVHKHRINTLQAIALIKKCGGVSSLAHPDIELANHFLAGRIIAKLAKAELWGMEMPHNFLKNKKHLLPLAKKYGLTITYGSDTHDGKYLGVKISEVEWQKISNFAA